MQSSDCSLAADAPSEVPVAVALLREGVPTDLARELPTPEVGPQVVLQIGYLYERFLTIKAQFLADAASVVCVCAACHLVHLGMRVPQFDVLVNGQLQVVKFGTMTLLLLSAV